MHAFAGKPAACSLIPILFYLASSGACFSCSDAALCQSTYGADADGLLLLLCFFFFSLRDATRWSEPSESWIYTGNMRRETGKRKPTWRTWVWKCMFFDPTSASDNGDLSAAHFFSKHFVHDTIKVPAGWFGVHTGSTFKWLPILDRCWCSVFKVCNVVRFNEQIQFQIKILMNSSAATDQLGSSSV